MRDDLNLILAGFGGQGLLFAGKVAAYGGHLENRNISWLPSYGPEMRGGTANCSVCISDNPIGSPLILSPNALIVMNLPSFDKFIGAVVPGGVAVIDDSMISKKCERDDIRAVYVPATKLSEENNLESLANIILLGKLFHETGFCSPEALDEALVKSVPASKRHLLDPNRRALELGAQYA